MSDQNAERDKAVLLEEELRALPREVRNILNPVRLSGKDQFQFRCHSQIACFNKCCSNIEILLTPYDILRLRQRLKLTPEEFLYEYATPFTLSKGQLPVALMKLDPETGKCPLVTPEGCSVYEDRPVTCRYYPIGLALMHKPEATAEEEFYFLIKEAFCEGHKEQKTWTVADWRGDQGSEKYDERNRSWMEIILKRRSAGDATSTSVPVSEFFYMATTNPPVFRRFVFDSTFLQRFKVDEETLALIREDDEAITEFAFAWLKTVLFGDKHIEMRPEAFDMLKARKKQQQKEQQENPDNDENPDKEENPEPEK